MSITFEQLRALHPDQPDDVIRAAVAMLEREGATLSEIFEAEAQLGDSARGLSPDGLTRPMRELNAFAEENALRRPFRVEAKGA